jgi:hypothetical protein
VAERLPTGAQNEYAFLGFCPAYVLWPKKPGNWAFLRDGEFCASPTMLILKHLVVVEPTPLESCGGLPFKFGAHTLIRRKMQISPASGDAGLNKL